MSSVLVLMVGRFGSEHQAGHVTALESHRLRARPIVAFPTIGPPWNLPIKGASIADQDLDLCKLKRMGEQFCEREDGGPCGLLP